MDLLLASNVRWAVSQKTMVFHSRDSSSISCKSKLKETHHALAHSQITSRMLYSDTSGVLLPRRFQCNNDISTTCSRMSRCFTDLTTVSSILSKEHGLPRTRGLPCHNRARLSAVGTLVIRDSYQALLSSVFCPVSYLSISYYFQFPSHLAQWPLPTPDTNQPRPHTKTFRNSEK